MPTLMTTAQGQCEGADYLLDEVNNCWSEREWWNMWMWPYITVSLWPFLPPVIYHPCPLHRCLLSREDRGWPMKCNQRAHEQNPQGLIFPHM